VGRRKSIGTIPDKPTGFRINKYQKGKGVRESISKFGEGEWGKY